MSDRVTSEDALIAEFLAPLAAGFEGALGLKDDCAVIAPPAGHEIVVKTDPVVEGVHFLPDADPEDVAWRALAVNVSDLAAKGAVPLAYLMALSFPAAPERAWLARFAAGLGAAQRAFGCALAGGDTDRAPGPLRIGITVFGTVPSRRMVRRAAARAGDLLYVSGTLGDGALGLKLVRGVADAAGWRLGEADKDHLLRRFLRPEPRLGLRAALLDHARAAMDLSDGLAKDLGRMAAASGIAATVDAARLPLSPAFRSVLACDSALLAAALSAGDDYEVLASVDPRAATAFEAAAAAGGVAVTRVGTVTAGTGVTILGPDGRPLALARAGYDHF